MDWSKAKVILIIVFIILNIFLLANIGINLFNDNVSRGMIPDTVKILRNKGVTIAKGYEIPTFNNRLAMLVFENNDFDKKKIAEKLLGAGDIAGDIRYGRALTAGDKEVTFKDGNTFIYTDKKPGQKINTSDRTETEKQLKRFLNSLGLDISRFVPDESAGAQGGNITFVFIEKYNGLYVFDNYIKIMSSPDGITYLECKIKKIKGFSKSANKILPAHQILLLHDFNAEKEPVAVTRIDIGFRGFATGREEQVTKEFSEGPAWRIVVDNNTARYFKAYDGEEIK